MKEGKRLGSSIILTACARLARRMCYMSFIYIEYIGLDREEASERELGHRFVDLFVCGRCNGLLKVII